MITRVEKVCPKALTRAIKGPEIKRIDSDTNAVHFPGQYYRLPGGILPCVLFMHVV